MGYRSPESLGGSGTGIMLYVEDVDTVFQRAVEAGAKAHQAVKDQFYGDRSGSLMIRSATCGRSPPMLKTYRRTN